MKKETYHIAVFSGKKKPKKEIRQGYVYTYKPKGYERDKRADGMRVGICKELWFWAATHLDSGYRIGEGDTRKEAWEITRSNIRKHIDTILKLPKL